MDMRIAIATLFLAGLGGSLHCIGMCGPILIGFSKSFSTDTETKEATDSRRPSSLRFDFMWYHTGRIWTYGMLGFAAGLLGREIAGGSAWLGWQQWVGLAFGVLVVFSGVALLGLIPGFNLNRWLSGCAFKRFGPASWFRSLLDQRGALPRLLLGAMMGLLPCGLVYGALLLAAGAQSPVVSALGMIAFGVGTIPALTSTLVGAHLIPTHWRLHGTRFTGLLIMLTGAWMVWRSAMAESGICACGIQ